MTKPIHQTPLRATYSGRCFRIEFGGEGIGYSLYIFGGERCTHDYLQDTLDNARRLALEEFGVSTESRVYADEAA